MSNKQLTFSNIQTQLNLSLEVAKTVHGLMNDSIDPESFERFPQTYHWIRQCFNRPSEIEIIMSAINEVAGFHGVEYAGPEIDSRFTPRFSYCNAGDTYNTTIVHDNETSDFIIGCLGDLIESLEDEDEDEDED